MPLAAVMRSGQGCDIYISNLGINPSANNIILGSTFLQQFMVEYIPSDVSNGPRLTLSQQTSSLEGSLIKSTKSNTSEEFMVIFAFVILVVSMIVGIYLKCMMHSEVQDRKNELIEREEEEWTEDHVLIDKEH
jgi:hypothetical protein